MIHKLQKIIFMGFDDFDPYWLRLFDEYAVQTYENGWIDWVEQYDIKNN